MSKGGNGFKSPTLAHAESVRHVAPRRVRPTGILHFTLAVTDLERSRRFYEEVVGCTFWRQNDSTAKSIVHQPAAVSAASDTKQNALQRPRRRARPRLGRA